MCQPGVGRRLSRERHANAFSCFPAPTDRIRCNLFGPLSPLPESQRLRKSTKLNESLHAIFRHARHDLVKGGDGPSSLVAAALTASAETLQPARFDQRNHLNGR